jgi:hypothetical protein
MNKKINFGGTDIYDKGFFFNYLKFIGFKLFTNPKSAFCFNPLNGIYFQPSINCSISQCPQELICAKKLETIFSLRNFDSFSLSSLQVFTVITLEGWTDVMEGTLMNFSESTWVYFVSLIILGNYIMVNLTLAILKVKFNESQKNLEIEIKKDMSKEREFNLQELKYSKLWIKESTLSFDFYDNKVLSEPVAAADNNNNKIIPKKRSQSFFSIEYQGNNLIRVEETNIKQFILNKKKKKNSLTKILFLVGKIWTGKNTNKIDTRCLKVKVMSHLPYNSTSKKDVLTER